LTSRRNVFWRFQPWLILIKKSKPDKEKGVISSIFSEQTFREEVKKQHFGNSGQRGRRILASHVFDRQRKGGTMLKKKLGILILVLVASFALAFSVSAEPRANHVYTGNLDKRPQAYVPGQVVVRFAESMADADVENITRGVGAKIKRRSHKRRFHLLTVPKGQVWKKIEALKKNPKVLYAHPDYLAYADFVPSDPYYSPYQWNLDNPEHGGIGMEEAWDINQGGNDSVIVAVLDTGVAYENFGGYCQAPDLAGTTFVAGYDFINNDQHPNDDNAHGTHVAGTIAQTTDNGIGVAGVAGNVSIMPVKVLASNGSGPVSTISEAINWAADHGAHIINMSLSTAYPSTVLEDAVNYAHSKGVLIIASSGNSSGSSPQYPAAYMHATAVGATTYNNRLAGYSNKGSDLCAPGGIDGEDLNGDGYDDMVLQNTFNPNTKNACDLGYWFFSGTSMAAPHVSGLAALILSKNPYLSNDEVGQILKDTADPLADETDPPSICGSGIINAHRALQMAAGFDAVPSVSIASPADGATVTETVTIQIDASDLEDPVESLTVLWNVDGDTWQPADYNSDTGYYEAEWDTTATADGLHTLNASVSDSAFNTSTDSSSVRIANYGVPPSIHIADLDGTSGRWWFLWWAAVDILVHDHNEEAVGNAIVDISWSDGSVDWCITGNNGWCSLVGYQFRRTRSLTLTVTEVSNSSLPYDPGLNHDPDGDSDGTSITVKQP
jgi:serine protease